MMKPLDTPALFERARPKNAGGDAATGIFLSIVIVECHNDASVLVARVDKDALAETPENRVSIAAAAPRDARQRALAPTRQRCLPTKGALAPCSTCAA